MEITEARSILAVGADADWPTVRAAHRRAIRRAHPDAGGAAADAARLNDALDVLRRVPPMAAAPAPTAPRVNSTVELRPDDVDRFFVVDGEPDDLLGRLAEAGHLIGEVVFVDRYCGILEIVVGQPPNVGQLAVTIGSRSEQGTPVSFTLDPLGVDPAPPIDQVVDALMDPLRGR